MQAKRMGKMIKEINHIIEYRETQFLPRVQKEVEEMQKKGLKVDIQYGYSNGICTALLIGRKQDASSKSIR